MTVIGDTMIIIGILLTVLFPGMLLGLIYFIVKKAVFSSLEDYFNDKFPKKSD